MRSLYGASDVLGAALSHIAGDFARRILDGPGALGPRRLETAPDKQPTGRCWAAEGVGGASSVHECAGRPTLVGSLSSQEPSGLKFLFS